MSTGIEAEGNPQIFQTVSGLPIDFVADVVAFEIADVGAAGLYTARNRHLLRRPYLVFLESSVLEFILFALESSGNQHGVLQTHTIDLPLHQLLVKLYWSSSRDGN